MQCEILKSFPVSRDGVKVMQAVKGGEMDIPDALVPGLEREGYVKPAGAKVKAKAQPAPDNKAISAAPENKAPQPSADDLTALRVEYEAIVGKRPFMGWKEDELRRRIAEAGA